MCVCAVTPERALEMARVMLQQGDIVPADGSLLAAAGIGFSVGQVCLAQTDKHAHDSLVSLSLHSLSSLN